ncbi:phosphatidylinositol mannoside acyltransferase [Bifidobacterium aquikefiricola]|uniref:Phosphatidylinositol mannoside acyltransferase n=1 Tax=Bifidobacterium aquikefiricola TaxID=3059038 RepID=A0AB39U988_9BIFI
MLNTALNLTFRYASHIPESLLRLLFSFAASLAWFFHIGGTAQLEKNLKRVLLHRDGKADHIEIRRLSLLAMRSYFAYFAEAMTVGARTAEQLHARIRGTGEGFAPIRRECMKGSALLAMGHQGNWDYAGFWAHDAIAPVTTVAERLSDEQLLQSFVDIRESLGMSILLTGEKNLTERLEAVLDEPHSIVPLLADRDLGRHGEFVEAFGSVIRVAPGPAVIALKRQKPLYVVNMHREMLSGARRKKAGVRFGYVCQISAPIDIQPFANMPESQAIHALSQRWVDVWAQGIAEHPEDWHMLQPIFLEDLDMSRMHDVPESIQAMSAASHRM